MSFSVEEYRTNLDEISTNESPVRGNLPCRLASVDVMHFLTSGIRPEQSEQCGMKKALGIIGNNGKDRDASRWSQVVELEDRVCST
jgi:hypothetical protein